MSSQTSPEIPAGPDSAYKTIEQVSTTSAKVENGNVKPSKDNDIIEKPSATSPNSKKRALDEGAQDDDTPSKIKKARDSPMPTSPLSDGPGRVRSSSPPDQSTTLDKASWLGFCDIESEPAYFSVILREMGVTGVCVREVFSMSPDILFDLPQPIFGFIVLYGYREFEGRDPDAVCPPNMWFANQMPAHNSCATLAMINIMMNSPEVDIGEHLTQFKDFTRDFEPYQCGEALASFDFVRKIHNSFAKEMDILEADKNLSYKVNKSKREVVNEGFDLSSTENKSNKEKKKPTPLNPPNPNPNNTTSTRPRRPSADTTTSSDSAKNYEARAHHYIAFIPSGASTWKLDGLDAAPTCMGTFDPSSGSTWLDAASASITALMSAEDETSEHANHFTIFALARAPLVGLRHEARTAFRKLNRVERALDLVVPAWRDVLTEDDAVPPSPTMLGIFDVDGDDDEQEDLAPAAVDENETDKDEADNDTDDPALLFDHRHTILLHLHALAKHIMAEMNAEAEDEAKATQRRFDTGPVIAKWLEMLAGNGWLEANLARFAGQ